MQEEAKAPKKALTPICEMLDHPGKISEHTQAETTPTVEGSLRRWTWSRMSPAELLQDIGKGNFHYWVLLVEVDIPLI